jgi:hypothetical protein
VRLAGTVLSLTLLAILLGIGIRAGARADELLTKNVLEGSRTLIYLPTPAQARVMSLGFQQVMADWYWVKGLQYFTDTSQELNQFRNLGDFLDVVVGIDPDFEYAYKFAGVAIPYDTGRFRFANTERAIEFLQRGVARFPRNWELHFYLGFYLLNFRENPGAAAEEFAAAAAIPGSPDYLKRFAARLFSAAGDLDRARVFAETMAESTDDPVEKEKLQARVRDIEIERSLREVEAAARTFKERNGRWPVDLLELGVTQQLPALPPGVQLEQGIARAPNTERMIVHEHPKEDPFRSAK